MSRSVWKGPFVDLNVLKKAETAIAKLPSRLRPAFASIAILKPQLADLNRHRASVFAPSSAEPDWRKILRLSWWGISSGR